jgi:type IV secretory pathway TrbF-like protein
MQSKIQDHRDKYKAYKKEYNVVIKTVKTNYIQHIISSSNNTCKVLWELIKRERGSQNNTLTYNMHLKVENETV